MIARAAVVQQALHVVATTGLARTTPPVSRLALPHAIDLCDAASDERLLGLLDQALAEGALTVDDDASPIVTGKARAAAAWALVAERHLLAVHDALERAGIEHRFIGGAVNGHLAYEHPAQRTSVEVDVLVPDARFVDTVELLASLGHEQRQPEPYAGHDRRWARSVTMVDGGTQVDVEVHRLLADGAFGLRSHTAPLWSRPPGELAIGGVAVPVLDPAAALVVASANLVASEGRVSMASGRDVVELGRRSGAGADVAQLAEEMGLRACVTAALQDVATTFGWDPPGELAQLASQRVEGAERSWLDGYGGSSGVQRALSGLRAAPSLTGKAAHAGRSARLAAGRRARQRALADCGPCRRIRIR